MTIDDRIYRQRVHQAQAQLAMKQAALNNNLQQRRSAEATIQSNKAALENAKAQALKSGFDLKRVENLTADGSLSVRERDAARAADAQRRRRYVRLRRRSPSPSRICKPSSLTVTR